MAKGYPRPRLIWKRNGRELTNNDPDVISLLEMKLPAMRNKTTADKGSNNDPTSELTIRVRPEDDQAVYSCFAQNSAMDKPLNTSVKLTVHCEYQSIFLFGAGDSWESAAEFLAGS